MFFDISYKKISQVTHIKINKKNLMAMKTKVVIGGSTVTAGQLKDFFRMIDDGTIGYPEMERFLRVDTPPSIWVSAEQLEILFKRIKEEKIGFAEMKEFLNNPKKNVLAKYPTYVRAINILGREKVVTVQEAYRLWNIPYSIEDRHTLDKIRYSEATLRICAAQNQRRKANWYLIYIIGYSLVEQHQKLGIRSENQFCFHYLCDWFLDKKEESWAGKKSESGYYLVNLNLFKPENLEYIEQKENAKSLGSEYEVLEPQMFSEIVFSLKTNDKNGMVTFLWHRSLTLTSTDKTISIGILTDLGLRVDQHSKKRKDNSLRMCTYKKHEF